MAMSDFRREKVCNKVVEGEIKEQEHRKIQPNKQTLLGWKHFKIVALLRLLNQHHHESSKGLSR